VAEAARSNAATEIFLRQQRELNSLSAAELALRRETAQVQEQAAEAGAALSEQEARAVAVAAAAADAIRNAGSRRSDKGGGGGGGGGRSAAPRADAYAEMVAETRAATEATFEYGRAAEVAALRQDLLVAAQKSGRDITPELTAETEELADAYVSAMERADALTETMDGLKDAGRSAFVGLLKDGKSLKEGLADLFDDLATQLAGSIFDGLFDGRGGGRGKSGGGLAGLVLGLLGGGKPRIPGFAKGTADFEGGVARINEEGGEIVLLPGGTAVVPHDLSAQVLADQGRADRANGAERARAEPSEGLVRLLGMMTGRYTEKFARGVANFGGGAARINEEGGEIVLLPGGSAVVPHDLSERVLADQGRGRCG
jgi:hypothetical protein